MVYQKKQAPLRSDAQIDFGYRPRKWQIEMHANLKRFSCLVCHRRAGKTVAAIMTLIDAATRKKKAAQFGYLAPQLKQAKTVAWEYLKEYARKVPGVKINESELWVEFPNHARIRLYGADNPDSLRGIYLNGIVMDEVAQMKPGIWLEVILPALSDRQGWALFIGTPKGINLFSEMYNKARAEEDWYAGVYTVYDTDALPAEEVARMKADMSDNVWRQEMLCDFTASTDNTLINIDQAEEAARRAIHSSAYQFAPRIIGVDVAREGGDRSVIFPRQGLAAFRPKVFASINNMDLASQVAASIDKWQPDAVFIDSGRGEGVIDRLRQLGKNVLPVNFGGVPNNPRYQNKRAEMWDVMAKWILDGGCIPNDRDLKEGLCSPTFEHSNVNDKFQLEGKKSIKARGLPSPDLADALALTFAFPVTPKHMQQQRQATASKEYNPLDGYR